MGMLETITLPGFVDVHTHLREPSSNPAETISNGSLTALLGGYALICDMPNNPGNPTWSEEKVDEKLAIRDAGAYTLVEFYAGAQPEADNVHELEAMSKKTIGLKLYGSPNVSNYQDYDAGDFGDAIREWHRVAPTKPILLHRGESDLEEMVQLITTDTDHQLHVCHVNNPDEVEVVAAAKRSGLPVTCGVCPHHLFKTSHDSMSQGWFARMLPPLAHQDDAEELWSLLVSGDIDLVETDYAPHSRAAKWQTEQSNPTGEHSHDKSTCYGVPGIEHVVPLLLRQVKLGRLSMERLIEVCSTTPQQMLGMQLPPNTQFEWRMDEFRIENEAQQVHSGTQWTPYLGMLGTGTLQHATINGQPVVRNGITTPLERSRG